MGRVRGIDATFAVDTGTSTPEAGEPAPGSPRAPVAARDVLATDGAGAAAAPSLSPLHPAKGLTPPRTAPSSPSLQGVARTQLAEIRQRLAHAELAAEQGDYAAVSEAMSAIGYQQLGLTELGAITEPVVSTERQDALRTRAAERAVTLAEAALASGDAFKSLRLIAPLPTLFGQAPEHVASALAERAGALRRELEARAQAHTGEYRAHAAALAESGDVAAYHQFVGQAEAFLGVDVRVDPTRARALFASAIDGVYRDMEARLGRGGHEDALWVAGTAPRVLGELHQQWQDYATSADIYVTHRVRRGETLAAIARRHAGGSAEMLRYLNRLPEGEEPAPGDELRLPERPMLRQHARERALAVRALAILERTPAVRAALPDLTLLPPRNVEIARDRGARLLVFDAATANIGPGPLSILPAKAGAKFFAYQALHAADAAGNSTSRAAIVGVREAGVFTFAGHEDHNHFHFAKFAQWRLLDGEMQDVRGARPGDKYQQGFNLWDNAHVEHYTGPSTSAPAPDPERGYKLSSELGRQGLSRGWVDVYWRMQQGQAIDVTRVPDGTYTLVQELTRAFQEHGDNYENNRVGVRVRISGDQVEVLGHLTGAELTALERRARASPARKRTKRKGA